MRDQIRIKVRSGLTFPFETRLDKSDEIEDGEDHFFNSHHVVHKNLSLKLINRLEMLLLPRVQSHVGGLERIPE